jgi:hypothetical protein
LHPKPAECRGEQNYATDFIFSVAVSNGGEEEPSAGREPGIEVVTRGRFRLSVEPTADGDMGI